MERAGRSRQRYVGLKEQLLAKDPDQHNNKFNQKGYVFYIEGKKGEQGKEWGRRKPRRTIRPSTARARSAPMRSCAKSVADAKPFYMAWWPLWTSFLPDAKKVSLQRGMVGEAYEKMLDPAVGRLMDFLRAQGLAENTLIVAMSDNGPMTHNPPPGAGLGEGIFRGGKGEFTEGARTRGRAGMVARNDQARLRPSAISSTSPISIRPSRASAAQPSTCRPTGSSTGWTRRRCCSTAIRMVVGTMSSSISARTLAATMWKQYKRRWGSGGEGSASGISAAFLRSL